MTSEIPRGLREERGQTLVEFAVVSIIVLTVIFGVLETGRLMLDYITLAEAARAGVRYAIVRGVDNPAPAGGVLSVVQGVAGLAGITLVPPTAVTYGANGTAVGSTVTVTASYKFTPVAPVVSGLGVTISSTSQGTIIF